MRSGAAARGTLAAAALLLAAAAYLFVDAGDAVVAPVAAPAYDETAARIAAAHREQRSDLWFEAEGVVERLLEDDRHGSRHQRFIVRLSNEHTLLIAHNIDLAERVPAEAGDRVRFRGEYEWNERGGVIHWTHHDPQNRHGGGWIAHEGRRYR